MTLAFIAKADGKKETRDKIIRMANYIKFYAAIIILFDLFVIIFLSERGGGLNEKIKAAIPKIYNNLDLIGFRVFVDPNHPIGKEEVASILKTKFMSHIAYLMVAIYLSNLYRKRKDESKGERLFDNKCIFEIVQKGKVPTGRELATYKMARKYKHQIQDLFR
jgi:hypothetical protein